MENEQRLDIAPLKKHSLMLRNKIYQMQVQIEDEVLKVHQVEARLEEILGIASHFKDKTQDVLEILQRHLTWSQITKEPPTNAPIKDSKRVKLEYELIEFGNKTAKELIRASHKTKVFCTRFCTKVLTTYNHCQISTKKSLYELP